MLINLSLSTLLDKKLGEEKKLSDLKKNKENNYKKYLILFKEMNVKIFIINMKERLLLESLIKKNKEVLNGFFNIIYLFILIS